MYRIDTYVLFISYLLGIAHTPEKLSLDIFLHFYKCSTISNFSCQTMIICIEKN